MQPAHRCGPGTPLLARYGGNSSGGAGGGCPQWFPFSTSILGEGALGAHGGSGLSSVGGTIRLGELLPNSGHINHALKLELQHQWYYGQAPLQPASEENGGRRQYLWPASATLARVISGIRTGNFPNVLSPSRVMFGHRAQATGSDGGTEKAPGGLYRNRSQCCSWRPSRDTGAPRRLGQDLNCPRSKNQKGTHRLRRLHCR